MAKCIKCGKKGFMLKVDANGHCSECAIRVIEQKHTEELSKLQIQNEELQARNLYLTQELEKARSLITPEMQSVPILRATIQNLKNEIGQSRAKAAMLDNDIKERESQVQALDEQIAAGNQALEKKLKTTENRIAKGQRLYESIQYTIRTFEEAPSVSGLASVLSPNADIEEFRPDLKCLSVKALRSLFKKNAKSIQELTASYQSHYTTKTNAAIYQLMTMALDAELTNILHDLAFGKLEDGIERVKTLTAKYYTIAKDGNQTIAPTLRKFIGQLEYLYIEAVKIEYEYYTQQARIKEEQRALREQMRQEAEDRKRLEQQRKQIENEEKKYQQEMARVKAQMEAAAATDAEVEKLRQRLAELENQMSTVETKKEDIINLQNGKAGTVYIISNIGSFGEGVYKVGMTRRLEPQERIDELGNASVPFPFDVHCFIFSEDAVALENRLHTELNSRRVNRVNLRKEFFSISIDELRQLVERIDPTASFTETALAEQYRQSLSMGDDVVGDIPVDNEQEESE